MPISFIPMQSKCRYEPEISPDPDWQLANGGLCSDELRFQPTAQTPALALNVHTPKGALFLQPRIEPHHRLAECLLLGEFGHLLADVSSNSEAMRHAAE